MQYLSVLQLGVLLDFTIMIMAASAMAVVMRAKRSLWDRFIGDAVCDSLVG